MKIYTLEKYLKILNEEKNIESIRKHIDEHLSENKKESLKKIAYMPLNLTTEQRMAYLEEK